MSAATIERAQASLPALAVALLVLASVTVLSLAVADGALAAADRDPNERHVASGVAERLVDPSGPVAVRQNVLDGAALDAADAASLRSAIHVLDDEAVRVTVGRKTVAASPNARDGTTVRRIVVVRRIENRTLSPDLGGSGGVTLPRRTAELDLSLDPPNGTTVYDVRANGRVLLRNADGVNGNYSLDLSRFETVRLRFNTTGSLEAGNVTLSYPIERTRKETLAVTVDG